MTRTVTYFVEGGGTKKISYDENAPCIICGEPVISASMGGTVICGACDCGRCRYCDMPIFVMRKEIDGGHSKKQFLEHIKWHHEHTPELVEKINSGHRKFAEAWDKRKENKVK